ncbi:DUF885 family protein, partial [Candidatus Woesearchaeota archaeon]|nr:DUF885 family protein [Candidatus Woesearchaeota archaeon]
MQLGKLTKTEKELFTFWKTVAPASAFAAGCRECAGKLWIPTKENKAWAKQEIKRLLKKADAKQRKWLLSLQHDLLQDEPHVIPSTITNVIFDHLVLCGMDQKQLGLLFEQSITLVHEGTRSLREKWPLPIRALSRLSIDGAIGILKSLRPQLNRQNRLMLAKLAAHLTRYGQIVQAPFLGKGDFEAVYPVLKKHPEHVGRKQSYARILREHFDYPETHQQIGALAKHWLQEELTLFRAAIRKLAKRYKCAETVEAVDAAINKAFPVKPKKALLETRQLRTLLQPIAENTWVGIAPKYDVRLIETPDYLVPFIPTGAMQIYDYLTKRPFCIFFITTSGKGSPASSLPDLAQLIIHEECGHCVNFMNTATQFVKRLSLVERIPVMLSTPITEGISFHRELEAQRHFEHILAHPDDVGAADKRFVKLVERVARFDDFVDAMRFVVYQWRMLRFVRAMSDVAVNTERLTVAEAVDMSHKLTGLSKKLVYDQVFSFQREPGYAPCYSIFGQKLAELQRKAVTHGFTVREFNTYVASMGFPARTIAEQDIAK